MNKTAKTPSIVPMAVMAKVRFTGPRKISATITTFSMTDAVKIGTRVAGMYALYTVNAQTTQSSAPPVPDEEHRQAIVTLGAKH